MLRDPCAPNPRKTPARSSQNQCRHLFHLIYQVHIRLGSPFPSLGGHGKDLKHVSGTQRHR
jgi:hypothetical protein